MPAPPPSRRPQVQSTVDHTRIPALEWAVGALGLVLVVGAVGFLLYAGLVLETAPPELAARVREVHRSGQGWRVGFVVQNRGGDAAAEVAVTGTLSRNGEAVESGRVVVDYVAPHSERHGGFTFLNDPRALDLTVRTEGYRAP